MSVDLISLFVKCFKCIKMEHELVTMMKCCPKKFSDEISQSHKVTKCANEISKMKCCEFPAAAIALKVCPSLLLISQATP